MGSRVRVPRPRPDPATFRQRNLGKPFLQLGLPPVKWGAAPHFPGSESRNVLTNQSWPWSLLDQTIGFSDRHIPSGRAARAGQALFLVLGKGPGLVLQAPLGAWDV